MTVVRADFVERRQPVENRHVEIEQADADVVLREQLNRLAPVRRKQDAQAASLERALEERPERRVVVGDQDDGRGLDG